MKNQNIIKLLAGAFITAVVLAGCTAKTEPEQTTVPELTPQEEFAQNLEKVATLDNVKYKNRELIIGGTTTLCTLDATAPDEDAIYRIVKDYIDKNEDISWRDDKRAFSRESISGVRIDDADTVIYHLGFLTKDGYNYVSVSDDKITGYSSMAKDVFTEYTRYLCHDVLGDGSTIDVFEISQCKNLIDKDYKNYYLIKNTWTDSRDKEPEYKQSGYEVLKNNFEKSDRITVTKTIKLSEEEFGNIAYGIRFLNNNLGFACAGGYMDGPSCCKNHNERWRNMAGNEF